MGIHQATSRALFHVRKAAYKTGVRVAHATVKSVRHSSVKVRKYTVRRMGKAVQESMDEQAAFIAHTGVASFHGTRYAVRGARSVARGVRHIPQLARQTMMRMHAGMRVTVKMARMVGAWVTRMAAGAGVSVVVSPVLVGVVTVASGTMAIVGLWAGLMSFFTAHHSTSINIPAEYEAYVVRAGSVCADISPSLIASQIQHESGFNPHAVSPVGAQGIAQFMPSTWAAHGKDGNNDGRSDVFDPADAIYSQGVYMCDLARQVTPLARAGKGSIVELALAAYNAGLGAVDTAQGIPAYRETVRYVKAIMDDMASFEAFNLGSSSTVGTLTPVLRMIGQTNTVDIASMGIHPVSTSYEVYQCTWWVDVRRKMIGRLTHPYMGNGNMWDNSAKAKGWPVSTTPSVGAVMVFEAGVHGTHSLYGHVAVVEAVNPDGSILISQSGTGFMRVVTETISAAELARIRTAISFIN